MSVSVADEAERLASRMKLMQAAATAETLRATLTERLDRHEAKADARTNDNDNADDDDAEGDAGSESRRQARRTAIDQVQRRCTALYQRLAEVHEFHRFGRRSWLT
jgi:hypothetical protein